MKHLILCIISCAFSLVAAHELTNQNLKILIVGSGAREHALAYKIAQSPQVNHVFVAPGNGGTQKMHKVCNIAIPAHDIDRLTQFALQEAIDFTIVGPEDPLAAGIVDEFNKVGLLCLGPTQAAAQLESSKCFAKHFMARYNIPTAPYTIVTNMHEAETYINEHPLPFVIKADGLAQGKGVIIPHSTQEALEAARTMLSGAAFGNAGRTLVFEQFIEGEEVSFIVLTDGNNYLPLATTQDYKRRNEGDTGPNTGGIGGNSPAPCITPELHDRILREIIEPTIDAMAKQGMPFRGFLYAGLMITPQGDPKVLEFNCRLGDPEALLILSRMKTDLVDLCLATLQEKLATLSIEWDPRKAVTVVVTDEHYPGKNLHLNQQIVIDEIIPDVAIFHASTRWNAGQLVSSGGRILSITALGDSFAQARTKAYAQVEKISLPHKHYRTDIARRLIH